MEIAIVAKIARLVQMTVYAKMASIVILVLVSPSPIAAMKNVTQERIALRAQVIAGAVEINTATRELASVKIIAETANAIMVKIAHLVQMTVYAVKMAIAILARA